MKNLLIGLTLTLAWTLSATAQVVISEIHYHPVEEPAFNSDGTPYLAAAQMDTLNIANQVPTITVQNNPAGQITLLITGDAGPNYTVEASENLVDWVTAWATNAPAMPFSWTDTNAASQTARFYRVGLEA